MKHFGTCMLLIALLTGLTACQAAGEDAVVETGEIDGAPFRIQIPAATPLTT